MADFENGDVVRLGAVQLLDGTHQIVNVFHMQINSGGPMAFAQASLDFQEYLDLLYTPLSGSITNTQTADRVGVANVTQGLVFGNMSWGTYTGGAASNERTTPQAAMLVFGRTTISRVQIRKYLGVFTEINQQGGVWAVGLRTLGLTFISTHILPQTMTQGLTLQGVAYRPTPVRVLTALSGSVSVNTVIQRRRRLGTGA